MTRATIRLMGTTLLAMAASGAAAQDWKSSYTLYGTPGLIEMPTANALPDGTIAVSAGKLGPHTRSTILFQATPWVWAAFRYTRMRDIDFVADEGGSEKINYFDRSFDVQFQLMQETGNRPAVALGLRDLLGTGLYSSEYVVASKTFGDRLNATAGIGWGQLGGRGSFDNPLSKLFGDSFNDRTLFELRDRGGQVNSNQFFRGPAALFGGVEYTLTDSLRLKAEYSSDLYQTRSGTQVLDQKSPLSFGISYAPGPSAQYGLYYVNGTEVGIGASFAINPNNLPSAPYSGIAPAPVKVRPGGAAAAASWAPDGAGTSQFASALGKAIKPEGLLVHGAEVRGNTLRLRYENTRYQSEPKALGRMARILTNAVPASVERFQLERVMNGVAVSSVTLSRSDLERLENELGAAEAILARTQITGAGSAAGMTVVDPERQAFTWGIGPYAGLKLFDLNEPVSLELGLEGQADWQITPALVASGRVRLRLTEDDKPDPTEQLGDVPVVRRDIGHYGAENRLTLEHLTLTHYGKLSSDIYTKASLGYLEAQYGGLSGEVLWKPVDSRLALGGELSYAVKRDYEKGFGFDDYNIVTGHVSAYYEFDRDYVAQVHAGRYLAGDWGATFALDRHFPNGWSVGGYFTLTDIAPEDFGTGSFDKGIRATVPFDWLLGNDTRKTREALLPMGIRDGGQRLRLEGRLYDKVRPNHAKALTDSWGGFWE